MTDQSHQLVQKLWNYCNILRDDGLSYGDYASAWLSTGSEQLTFLLFLKMADEQSRPPFNKRSPIPKGFDWASLLGQGRRRAGKRDRAVEESMSEYQYYEFQALDRPLTQEQMSKLRAYSSRAQITPYSFVNVYNWGDFKGNPRQWMEQYFDAFLYFANWGSRRFMLRLPKKLLDPKAAAPYCAGNNLSCRQNDDHIILSFEAELEDYDWEEERSGLASLVPIRTDLMRGDHRALYLGWLLAVQFREVPDGGIEPSVPPRLGEPNASLVCLVDFLGIDADLISAAAERSADQQAPTPSRKEIGEWVRTLPSARLCKNSQCNQGTVSEFV
jgi:hypothetical protein